MTVGSESIFASRESHSYRTLRWYGGVLGTRLRRYMKNGLIPRLTFSIPFIPWWLRPSRYHSCSVLIPHSTRMARRTPGNTPTRPPVYVVGAQRASRPLVSPEHVRGHLRLLRAFYNLRITVEDCKDRRIPGYAMQMDKDARWRWFVHLAVERYVPPSSPSCVLTGTVSNVKVRAMGQIPAVRPTGKVHHGTYSTLGCLDGVARLFAQP